MLLNSSTYQSTPKIMKTAITNKEHRTIIAIAHIGKGSKEKSIPLLAYETL